MAKNHFKRSRIRKSLIAMLAATAITCTGLATACSSSNDDDDTTKKRSDTQILKNGDFEFFGYPSDDDIKDGKAVYLIKSPSNWSRGGDSSNAMSGIINIADWASLTADDLADKLDYNNDLESDDEKHIDYNGMKSRDLLYKDTYAALLKSSEVENSYIKNQSYMTYFGIMEDGNGKYFLKDGTEVFRKQTAEGEEEDKEFYLDQECTKSVRMQLINNPGTHYGNFTETDGKYYFGSTEVTLGENGSYFYYTDGDSSNDTDENKTYISNVLMVHNYPTSSTYNGISQYYTSESITLSANTAAEISFWVKTSDLKFDKGYSQLDEQDRGAFVEVIQTVNGTAIDSFSIKSINTEKILADTTIDTTGVESNGWLKYTVYVNSCDFADSTIQLRLGLGQSQNYEKCTGYAFFDDLKITKFRTLADKDCTYSDNEQKITSGNSCSLTSEDDEKIFIADKALSGRHLGKYGDEYRSAKDFHYLVDLASETGVGDTYNTVNFGKNVTAGLTTEKSDKKDYASAESLGSAYVMTSLTKDGGNYKLPKNLSEGIKTDYDLIGVWGKGENVFNNSSYAAKLNGAITGESAWLPDYEGNALVMLSAYGAAYTCTIANNASEGFNAFTVNADGYTVVSFWIKTADMNKKQAATVKITDVDDEKNTSSLSIDSTGVTTDFDDEKDIYNGWVQCFIFVGNNTENAKTFKIDFSFGNTSIVNTTATSYDYGWVAMADLRTLEVNEDIFKLASSGNYALKFSFGEEDESKDGNAFDSSAITSDIDTNIANPANYSGVNGGSSNVTEGAYRENYDAKNTNFDKDNENFYYSGLINRDAFENYDSSVWQYVIDKFGGSSATDAVSAWENTFGKECYQPLIIVNNLREYVDKAEATAETFKNGNYYIAVEDNYNAGAYITDAAGNKYRPVAESDEFDEEETYYSLNKVVNYGYVGASKSISANSYELITVRVKVSGTAEAYIYLVDSNTRKVLTYSTPALTFYYDEEGNVLSEKYTEDMTEDEHKAAIVYTLRDDGLYEDKDGEIYANLNSLTKSYKYYKYENNTFYDEAGNRVSFDDLQDGTDYYPSAIDHDKYADHYLCNSAGTRVYEYIDGTYYYLVSNDDGVLVKDLAVKNFETPARYDTAIAEEYKVRVTAMDTVTGPDGWLTINFFIHTGSESIDYRLELWCGERDSAGDTEDYDGAVAFDYCAYSELTTLSEQYSKLLGEYEDTVIEEYKKMLEKHDMLSLIDTDTENIEYYENLVNSLIDDGKLSDTDLKDTDYDVEKYFGGKTYGFNAKYYTYTLYDSAAYVPFNINTANDGETGYDYKITDFKETLAFLTFRNDEQNSINVFADYSAVDQNISIDKVDDGDGDTGDEDTGDGTSVWLYVASIVLVVALLLTLLSILLRDILKKARRKNGNKALNKNNYRQRKRYIRKLHLTENGEAEDGETVEGEMDEETSEDAPEDDKTEE